MPKARVIYASATGVSDVSNLVYADRLGLWGKGTCFETFNEFESFLQKRGLGGLEVTSDMYDPRKLSSSHSYSMFFFVSIIYCFACEYVSFFACIMLRGFI